MIEIVNAAGAVTYRAGSGNLDSGISGVSA
jgi:hypothetical protein